MGSYEHPSNIFYDLILCMPVYIFCMRPFLKTISILVEGYTKCNHTHILPCAKMHLLWIPHTNTTVNLIFLMVLYLGDLETHQNLTSINFGKQR